MLTIHAAYNYPPFLKGILRDLRPLWAAEETGQGYAVHWMDAAKGEHREAANRAVNPFGKIPAIRDGDFGLFESGAIVNYLFDRAGKAAPDAEARARAAQWCYAALNTIEPQTSELFLWDRFWPQREGRDKRRAELVAAAQARLAELDAALGDKPYLLGEELSPADILMVTAIGFGAAEPALFEAAPRVKTYVERCCARPAYRRAAEQQGKGP
jgi:glutathione S-transferase